MIGLHLAIKGRSFAYKTIVGGRIRELIPFLTRSRRGYWMTASRWSMT